MALNFASKVNGLAGLGKPFFFIIDYEMKHAEVWAEKEIPADVLLSVPGYRNFSQPEIPDRGFEIKASPPGFDTYLAAFNKVMGGIQHGNSYLLNLTFKTPLEVDASLIEIFYSADARYKLFFKDRFVVFSPEPFVQVTDGVISSFPMKGTLDAAVPDAKNVLLNDPKETAEHHTIVDLIRNDLAMVAEEVYVEQFKYIETISTSKGDLLQMSSKISGRLPEDFHTHLGDILLKLLPAGSISGAPKSSTLEIISDAENYERGYYTGIFGWFDGHNLDSAVMIRFIEKENGKLYFKSGGGITSMSDARKEYDELIRKIYVPVA